MAKSVLLSIRPEWVERILNRKKTIEVRKKFPKDYVGWVYIYCTKGKYDLINYGKYKLFVDYNKQILNGKVVARFWCDNVAVAHFSSDYRFICDNVEEISWQNPNYKYGLYVYINEKSCLTIKQLGDYVQDKTFYAINISKLEIFDEPKELSEFNPIKWNKCGVKDKDGLYQCNKCPYGIAYEYGGECNYKPLTKAPQNYCYVEGVDRNE